MRKYGRVDATQAQGMKDLRKLGFSVQDTSSIGGGFPDVVVACRAPWGPMNLLVEWKSPGGKMTPAQLTFHKTWKGPIIVAESVGDVLDFFEMK